MEETSTVQNEIDYTGLINAALLALFGQSCVAPLAGSVASVAEAASALADRVTAEAGTADVAAVIQGQYETGENDENFISVRRLNQFWGDGVLPVKQTAATNSANIADLQQDVLDITGEVGSISNEKIANLTSDVANLTFQLALAGLIDATDFDTVVYDEITTADAVNITSGYFDTVNKKVYI